MAAFLPPAPTLPGEAALEIFVYPGTLPGNRVLEETNKFSDCSRLEYLGRQMTAAAFTDVMAQRWPTATAEQLAGMTANTRINSFMERTAAAYQWNLRVRGYPPDFNRGSLEEAHRLFCTYAGGSETFAES